MFTRAVFCDSSTRCATSKLAGVTPPGADEAAKAAVLKQFAFAVDRGHLIAYANGTLALPDAHPFYRAVSAEAPAPAEETHAESAESAEAPAAEEPHAESAEAPAAEEPHAESAEVPAAEAPAAEENHAESAEGAEAAEAAPPPPAE